MASGTFEKTSLDWQIQQFWQRVNEWIEGIFARSGANNFNPELPRFPEWMLKGLFWLMIAGAIAWAGWQIYKLLSPYFLSYWRLNQGGARLVVAPPPQQSVAEWLWQAQAAQNQGNYQAACRALYLATLQQLSDRGMISQEVSRTDSEYLSLLQTLSLPQPYQTLIQTHERLCFDRVTASAETYDRCWQAYQEIERA